MKKDTSRLKTELNSCPGVASRAVRHGFISTPQLS